MNNNGLEAFNKGGPYPDGTIIVDAVHELVEGGGGILNEGKKLFYPVMKKDSKAKDTGGWKGVRIPPPFCKGRWGGILQRYFLSKGKKLNLRVNPCNCGRGKFISAR
jgi:hypothetical protein